MLSMRLCQSDLVNLISSIRCCQCDFINPMSSIQHHQSNVVNATLSIQCRQSDVVNPVASIWGRQSGGVNPVSLIQCHQSGVVNLKFLSIHLPTTNQCLFQSLWSKYDPAGWKGQGFAPVVCWLVASLLQFRVCRQHTTLYRGRRVLAGVVNPVASIRGCQSGGITPVSSIRCRQSSVVNPVASIQCRQSGVVDLKFLSICLHHCTGKPSELCVRFQLCIPCSKNCERSHINSGDLPPDVTKACHKRFSEIYS